MHSWAFQITATVMVALYLGCQGRALHLRNRASWDDLLSQLIPEDPSVREQAAVAKQPPDQAAQMWALCRNARALQQIAGYALRNFPPPDRNAAAKLHRDATVLRLRAYAALARFALGGRARTNA